MIDVDIEAIAHEVRRELGLGHKECVYRNAFCIALREKGIPFDCERAVSVFFHGQCCGMVQPDVIVNNEIVLEFKAVKSKLNGDNVIQLQRYLDLLNIDVGYLVNFWGTPSAEVQRVPLTDSTEVVVKTPDSSDRETV